MTGQDTKFHCFVCSAKVHHVRGHNQNYGKTRVLNLHERKPHEILCHVHSFIQRHEFKIIEIKTYQYSVCIETLTGMDLSSTLI